MPNQYSQPGMSQRLSTQQELRRAVDEMDFLADGFWEEEGEIPIQESMLKQFVPLDTDIRGEEGQNSREWSEVLDDFGSKRLYQERLADFLHFASVDYSSATLEMKLVNYFNDARAQTNPDGSPRYRATTFRSWLSVFSKFWKHCKLKDLKTLVPTLEDKIGKWEKKQTEVKQAKCFSREQLTTFFEMPTTVDNLLDKAYAAIALSFAARGAEVTTIMWDDVTQSVNSTTNETTINIRFQRTKVTGVPEKMLALITGRLEIKAIMEYAACFSEDQQTGRYFRKLSATRGGVGITNTKQNVGHNTLAKAAYRIAIRLGLEGPILYTGHTFRRSAATICAESGMTLPEIKLVTGHKSDTVAQRYIDQSTMMKQRASDVLSLGGLQLNEHGEQLRKRTFESERITETPGNTRKCRTSDDKENTPTNVYHITFNNCSEVNYQLPIKTKFD